MDQSLKILIVNPASDVKRLSEALHGYGHEVIWATTGQEGRKFLRQGQFDMALIELVLPDYDGLKLVTEANNRGIMPIVMADSVSVELARSAIRRGAYDYLLEPVQLEQIPVLVERALERRRVIVEREMVLKKLMESERLALIGTIATGMAHELKNPLATIEASLFNLRELIPERSPDIEACLQAAETDIANSTKIIHDLLGFASNRRFQPKKDAVALRPLLADLLAKYAPLQLAQEVNVTLDVNEANVISGDEGQLKELFQNLIMNAFQAMPHGGVLHVKSAPSHNGLVYVELADTGQGILPEHLERIMEPFFTTKTAGLGMGLYICSEIVKAHHGKIDVKSAPGKGTSFSVALPRMG